MYLFFLFVIMHPTRIRAGEKRQGGAAFFRVDAARRPFFLPGSIFFPNPPNNPTTTPYMSADKIEDSLDSLKLTSPTLYNQVIDTINGDSYAIGGIRTFYPYCPKYDIKWFLVGKTETRHLFDYIESRKGTKEGSVSYLAYVLRNDGISKTALAARLMEWLACGKPERLHWIGK